MVAPHKSRSTRRGSASSQGGQPYTGPLFARDFWVRRIDLVGQLNPRVKERIYMEHGRQLSGFGQSPDGIGQAPDGLGSLDMSGSLSADPNWTDDGLEMLEHLDDSYGSGIFSGPGTDLGRATANADMGVFSSNYSLPGYVGREVPYAVSRDISDVNGADVVMLPGGGFNFVESGGRAVSPPILGPTPRPPKWQIRRPPTGRMQPYSDLTNGGAQPQPPLNPHAAIRPGFRLGPARAPKMAAIDVPNSPRQWDLPKRSIAGDEAPSDEGVSTAAMFLWGGVLGVAIGAAVHALTKD